MLTVQSPRENLPREVSSDELPAPQSNQMNSGPLPRGLQAVRIKNGKIRYRIDIVSQYLVNGSDRRWLHEGTTRDEAEAQVKEIRKMIDCAKHGTRYVGAGPVIHSVRSVVNKFVSGDEKNAALVPYLVKIGMKRGYIDNVKATLEEFAGLYGHLPIMGIERELIDCYLDSMLKTTANPDGRAVSTVKSYRDRLYALFEYAAQVLKILPSNPVAATLPPVDTTPEDERRGALFVQQLPPKNDRHLLDNLSVASACAAAISLYHGQRLNAVVNLRVAGNDPDVDLIHGTIRFLGKFQKQRKRGAKPRATYTVHVSPHALHYITRQAQHAASVGSEWLFPSNDDATMHMHKNTVSKNFRVEATKAGYTKAFFHGLEHVHTTRVKSSGLADIDGKALAAASLSRRHDGTEVTKGYVHTPDADLAPIHARLDAWIQAQMDAEKRRQKGENSPNSHPRNEAVSQGQNHEGLKTLS